MEKGFKKYIPFQQIKMEKREWPDNTITKAPIWCSVDLRDGNQALVVPMNLGEKLEFFKMLVRLGFKEIEIGFPASNETEYVFCRRLIEDGLIRGWGLSQVDVDVIDRAQRVTPLSAIQNIYSMVERDSEEAIIPYCVEHNIGFVPFSPIASGLLSGKITAQTKFERHDDVRNWVPQLSKSNIAGNQPIIDLLAEYAQLKDATSAQVSLAWMLHKWPNVVPIPGSKNKGRIIENLDAALVELSDEEFQALDDALNACVVYGHRGLGGF